MSGQIRRIFAVILVGGFIGAIGCESADWSDPDYISKRLKEGDSAVQTMAIQKITSLPPEKQKKTVPALAKVYMQGGTNEEDAMRYLVKFPHDKAEDAYLKELKEQNTDYTGAAGAALGEAKLESAIPKMLEIYKEADDDAVKIGILRGFSKMPRPSMIGPLVETLQLDVDNHRIAMHSYSCEILGNIAQDKPEAFDDKAISALVRALFLGNKKGQNVGKECGLAVQQLGTPAVPKLIETFEGNNESVNKLLMTYNTRPSYKFPKNHAKVVAAEALGAMRVDKAVSLFIEDLESTKEAPDALTGKHAVSWRSKEAEATSNVLKGLGKIGNDEAMDVLEDVVRGEMTTDEWDDITDGFVELQLRQDAAFALVRLGNREAADTLIEMARDGVIIDIEKRAVVLEKKWNAMSEKQKKNNPNFEPMPILQRFQFNWMMAQAYAYLAGEDAEQKLEKLANNTEREELQKKYKKFAKAAKLGAECMGKDSDSAEAKCYGELLSHDDKPVRKKAAWELSRLPKDAAGPVILEHLGTDNFETRNILAFDLFRVPTKKAVAKIDKILKNEEDKSSDKYEQSHHRLKLVRAWLRNHYDESK